jgi:hypothetical protein
MQAQHKTTQKSAQPNNSTDVTPKALALEFDVDQRIVRVFLRRRFGANHKYWRLGRTQARRVRHDLRRMLGGVS